MKRIKKKKVERYIRIKKIAYIKILAEVLEPGPS